MSFNTIDIDYSDKTRVRRVIDKIKANKCLAAISVKPSSSKGYHILVLCKVTGCDLCRLAFDDPRRYAMDSNRPQRSRNVLFTQKHIRVKPIKA